MTTYDLISSLAIIDLFSFFSTAFILPFLAVLFPLIGFFSKIDCITSLFLSKASVVSTLLYSYSLSFLLSATGRILSLPGMPAVPFSKRNSSPVPLTSTGIEHGKYNAPITPCICEHRWFYPILILGITSVLLFSCFAAKTKCFRSSCSRKKGKNNHSNGQRASIWPGNYRLGGHYPGRISRGLPSTSKWFGTKQSPKSSQGPPNGRPPLPTPSSR